MNVRRSGFNTSRARGCQGLQRSEGPDFRASGPSRRPDQPSVGAQRCRSDPASRVRFETASGTRRGFTLLELALVVLVMGILAGMALMRMNDVSGDARETGALQTLEVLRNAIELYRAENGEYPGESATSADFKQDLKPYLRGEFPPCLVGNQNNDVRVTQVGGTALFAFGPEGWAYDKVSGTFIINYAGYNTY